MIPSELTQLRQWATSTGEKSKEGKAPLNPITKKHIKVNEPNTFISYEETQNYPALLKGFILTKQDPYTIIDLDEPQTEEQAERHKKILDAFDTYTEVSSSGKGVHIICRGSIQNALKRDRVEVYDSLRYMITTGNVLKDLPITDCQHILDVMMEEMGSFEKLQISDGEENWMSEATLVEIAQNACNGDKFIALCKGDLTGYPSQSEADLGLLSILCFYSRDNVQVKNVFRHSELGKRDKAIRNDTYLNRCLNRIRNNELPTINFGNVAPLAHDPTQYKALPTNGLACPPVGPKNSAVHLPPGTLGEVATYITKSNIRPVVEIGIAAAIAFMAGIVGRHYNISGTGLNQYIILMAPTGTGKEGVASGIDRLFSEISKTVPAIDDFQGPGSFASGQALVKRMADKPSFVSVLGEFGLILKRLASKNISPSDITLKQALLDLYQKSGWTSTLKSSVYSDKEKNSEIVQAPALTILGESTQESLLEELSTQMIADGLLPRFITIEYEGERPVRNRNAFNPPNGQLLEKLQQIALTVLAMQANGACCQVTTEQAALNMLDDFDLECDKKITELSEVYKHLWNRAHLKALKLAGLAAVADNWLQPVVSTTHAAWAITLVRNDLHVISKRFEDNTVGDNEVRFEAYLRKAVEQYATIPADKRIKSYAIPKAVAEDPAAIPYHYIRRRFRLLPAFVNHKFGVKAAIKLCIDDCLEAGIIQEVPADQIRTRYGTTAKVYVQGPLWGREG